MREPSLLRRTVLATSLALSLTGLSASVEVAEAMPASPTLARAGDAGALTDVQYMYYRRSYRRYYRRSRRAGPYNCGRNELHTHLEREACGMNGVGHNGRYR